MVLKARDAMDEVLGSMLKNLGTTKILISEFGDVVSSQLNSLLDKIEGDALQLKALLAEEHKLTRANRSSVSLRSVSASPSMNKPTKHFESSYEAVQNGTGMSDVKLTIECLDDRLKQCAFCVAVFPEDAVIKKQQLIHWWIGDGTVPNTGVGNQCFEELLYHGLILPVKHEHCDEVHAFRVDPGIRQQLIEAAKESNFLDLDPAGNPVIGTTGRVILIKGQERVRLKVRSMRGLSNQGLVSLYNVDQQYVHLEKSWFSGQRKLGTAQLGNSTTSSDPHNELVKEWLLKGIGACRNLRYLSLRGISRIESLPDSIGDLSNLIILDVRACHNLETLTSSVTSLKKLQYLDVSECYLLDQMPRGFDRLVNIEVLKGFVIGSIKSKDPCRLTELTRLDKLRKLSIGIGRQSVATNDELQQLGRLDNLRYLSVSWGVVASQKKRSLAQTSTGKVKITESIANMRLYLPPKIEKLDLRCVPFREFPDWLSPTRFTGLKRLYIRGGMLETLGTGTGGTWDVRVLRLRFLKNLKCDWNAVLNLFPRLCFSENWECENLISWPCNEQGIWQKLD